MSNWHSRRWIDYTSEQFSRLPRDELIAVLPVGRRVRAVRSVAWLAKYGVLIVGGRDPGVGT